MIFFFFTVSKSVATDLHRNITVTEGDVAILPCEAQDEQNKYSVGLSTLFHLYISWKRILISYLRESCFASHQEYFNNYMIDVNF